MLPIFHLCVFLINLRVSSPGPSVQKLVSRIAAQNWSGAVSPRGGSEVLGVFFFFPRGGSQILLLRLRPAGGSARPAPPFGEPKNC